MIKRLFIRAFMAFTILTLVLCGFLSSTEADDWTNLGLQGGQIYEIAIDPDNSDKMFAGAYYGDGLYLTQNGGTTWAPVLTGHEGDELDGEATFRNTAVWAVKMAPSNKNVMWVAHNYWVEKSTDGGANWTHIDNGTMQDDCTGCPNDSTEENPGSEQFRYCQSLAIDPSDPQTVYVGTGGPNGSSLKGAIYKTTDGGQTWTKMGIEGLFDRGGYAVVLDKEFYSTVVDIAIDPTDNDTIFALDFNDVLGDYRGFLYVSIDGGQTWNSGIGVPAYIAEQGLVVKPDEPNVVFIGCFGRSGDFGGIIRVEYQTDGSGDPIPGTYTWSSPLGSGSHNVRALAFDPQDSSVLYAAKGVEDSFQLLKSLDGGENFLEYPHDQQFISLAPHPTDSDIIFGGDRCLGVYKGELIGDHPDPLEIIIIDDGDSGTASTGSWYPITGWGYGESLLYSTEENATYTFDLGQSGTYEVSIFYYMHPNRCAAVPVQIYDGDTLLDTVTVNQQGVFQAKWDLLGLYTFSDTAKVVINSVGGCVTIADAVKFDNDLTDYSWTPIRDGINSIRVNDIAVDPNDSTHLLAGTMAGVYEKQGTGAWTSAASLRYTEAFSVAFDATDTDGSTYYAGIESYLAKTTDNGANWTLSNSLGYPHFVIDIAIDPNNNSTIFVTTRYPGSVYKSEDGGATLTGLMKFTAVLDSGPSHAASFTLDPDGSFTYTHNNDDAPSDSFTYHNNDGVSNSNTATVTIRITPTSSSMVAVDDTFTGEKGGTLSKLTPPGVLSNDIGSDIEVVLDDDVSNGTLSLYKDGSFTYIHDGSDTTTDTFTYHLKEEEGTGVSNIATVTIYITAESNPPVAVNDTYTVERGGTLDVSYPYYWFPQGVLHNDIKSNEFDFGAVVIDPSNSYHILAGGGNYFGSDVPGKLYESTDGGANWSTVLDNVTVNALLFDPDDSNIVYAGCGYSDGTDVPLYKSTNGGTTWAKSYEGIPAEPTRYGIWGNSANDIYVLSHSGCVVQASRDDKKVFHYDGTEWSQKDIGVSTPLHDIWGSSGSNVFAVGDSGTIVHHNGTDWTEETSGTTEDLLGVWSLGSYAFVVGENGTILRSTDSGSNWSSMTSGTTKDLCGVWGTSDGSHVYAVGSYGTILYSGNDGLSWSTMESGVTVRLLGIWGSSGSAVFAVGRDGTILHYDGDVWSSMISGTSGDLYAVWGSSGSDIYAVGEDGVILHSNGTSWSAMTSGTSARLYGVWGSSSTDVYAVGLYGTILNYTGSTWDSVSTGITSDLVRNWNAVTDLKYSPDTTDTSNIIYASTSLQGVYVSPNQGRIWGLLGPPSAYEILAMATGSCIIGTPNGVWQAGIGTILGWVTVEGTDPKVPVPDATVSVVSVGLSDDTDTNGIYVISGVTAGPTQYQVSVVKADGYGLEVTPPDSVWVYGGASTQVDFLLADPTITVKIGGEKIFAVGGIFHGNGPGGEGSIKPVAGDYMWSLGDGGELMVKYGDSVTLGVWPDPGFQVDQLLVDGDPHGPGPIEFVDMEDSHIIEATFVPGTNTQPSFASTAVTDATENVLYTYNITSSDSDLGDFLTITAPTKPGWLTLTDNGDGTATLSGTPTSEQVGDHNIMLQVTDLSNAFDTQGFTITVSNANDAPTDISLSSTSVAENQPIGTSVGTFSTTDPDSGDTHTYSLVSGTGDTDNASFSISGGTLLTAAIFDYETKNSYSIRVQTDDGNGGTYAEAFTITVTDGNDAPVAVAENYTVAESGTLNQTAPGVLENDTDAENDPLTAVLDSSPNHATSFTLGTDGSFTYTHDGGEDTSDSFTYRAYDGTVYSNTVTVTITIMEVIVEVNPHHNAGIDPDSTRVPNNTSFAVRIEDSDGIDTTDLESITFTIDDGINPTTYEYNLGNATVVRVVQLDSTESLDNLTKLWVIYDRSKDNAHGNVYSFEATITISVAIKDTQNGMAEGEYWFKVETQQQHNDAEANLPPIEAVDPNDPDLGGSYDAGIEVNSGDLEGAKIIYESSEPITPTLGPVDELPSFDGNNANAIGVPMNLQPPTVFNTPVKIFIPCPGHTDVSNLSVYRYNGTNWVLACDASGTVQPGGEGWMVPGSRVNHNNGSPSTIEIQVYHFTGVQAVFQSTPSPTAAGGGGGGCFIATAAYGTAMEPHVKVLRDFRDRFLINNNVGKVFIDLYNTYSPPVADFITNHGTVRFMVRWSLLPLVGMSWIAINIGSALTLIFMLLLSFGLVGLIKARRKFRQ